MRISTTEPVAVGGDTSNERRQRRSDDPLVALHYQLSHTRARGELDAVVVADPSGVVVAGAGSWPVCEELAAYAPLLAEGSWGKMNDPVSSRVDSLRREVEVRAIDVGGSEVLLCARHRRAPDDASGPRPSSSLEAAAAGVLRILRLAA